MIDRRTRDGLAAELRHFAAGVTTNDQFEARVESLPCTDAAIGAVLHAAWFLCDDLRTHRLRGRWALSREGKKEVARWILFLKSDVEYEWPFPSGLEAVHLLLGSATLGIWPLFESVPARGLR